LFRRFRNVFRRVRELRCTSNVVLVKLNPSRFDKLDNNRLLSVNVSKSLNERGQDWNYLSNYLSWSYLRAGTILVIAMVYDGIITLTTARKVSVSVDDRAQYFIAPSNIVMTEVLQKHQPLSILWSRASVHTV
jgi:hypothetical protein